jgi:hypothetical protein
MIAYLHRIDLLQLITKLLNKTLAIEQLATVG